MVFLQILIPKKEAPSDERKEEKKDFKEAASIMEQFFAGIHSVGWDCILSFEYAVLKDQVYFYVIVPRKYKEIVEKQITSFYSDAVVEQVEDYNIFKPEAHQDSAYVVLNKPFTYPLKTYDQLESDPLNTITNSLSKLSADEGAAIQIMIKPVKDKWQKKCTKLAERIYSGKKKRGFNPFEILGDFLNMLFRGESTDTKKDEDQKKITPLTEETVKAIEKKSHSVGFDTVIRLVTSAKTKREATAQLKNIISSFAQFSTPHINAFKPTEKHSDKSLIVNFIFRFFKRTLLSMKKMILSTEELASLFHFPSIKYNLSPNIKWQNYKIAPAPDNLPDKGLLLGYNFFRGSKKEVRLTDKDRFRHLYAIGQTGTGKTTFLNSLIRQDLRTPGRGVCLIDPHGDFADECLEYIPKERADDVIFFDPADTERPLGLNMLEADTDDEKEFVSMEAMNIMIKLFGPEIFGPRIQDYFRNGVLTLMADPEGGALTDIVNLFVNEEYQKQKIAHVTNPIVKTWWEKTYHAMGAREKAEIIPYFQAKFGQFITNKLMRNIIGQTKSSFDFLDVMQNGKILLMKMSKGLTGEINSKLLGMIIVTKLQVAAMQRQKIPMEERRDFFLYIDEFQNYVTDSIESILSEARKYRLGLVLAHQYIDQLEQKGELTGGINLKGAVFGNVGTIVSLKIGAPDAEFMEKEMAPVFSQHDLVNLDAFKGACKLSIENQISRPFSLNVLRPWVELKDDKGEKDLIEPYKQLSRLKYGRDVEFVNREIIYRCGAV